LTEIAIDLSLPGRLKRVSNALAYFFTYGLELHVL